MTISEFIKLNRTQVANFAKDLSRKGYIGNLIEIQKIGNESMNIKKQIDDLRMLRNKAAKKRDRKAGEKIKLQIQKIESKFRKKNKEFFLLWLEIPNVPDRSIPDGGEDKNKLISKFGKIPKIKNPKNHIQLGKDLDIIDIERGVKTSGSRFYFLKNQAVELEFALVQWVMALLKKEKFELLITPQLIQNKVMSAGGYLGQAENEIYKTQDNLYLIGTSEQSVLGYHIDEIITVPKRYAAFSTCFRREAGSYGKDVKGIIRTHQFDKVEMFSFVEPQKSVEEHEKLVQLEEKILKELEIPYQKVLVAAGDLGVSAAKKIDLESWIPSQNRYRETHSCSNCTDWQARRANIKYRKPVQKDVPVRAISTTDYVHTLNGTAIAIGRLLVALLENHQQLDGSVKIPKILHKYLSFKEIK